MAILLIDGSSTIRIDLAAYRAGRSLSIGEALMPFGPTGTVRHVALICLAYPIVRLAFCGLGIPWRRERGGTKASDERKD